MKAVLIVNHVSCAQCFQWVPKEGAVLMEEIVYYPPFSLLDADGRAQSMVLRQVTTPLYWCEECTRRLRRA